MMDKKVLLVADDDVMSRETIHRFLGGSYEVLEAADGNEALALLHERKVDVVILDIVMPGCSGYDVLQQVKCNEKFSDLRILVATAVLERSERKALEMGADDIVFKPYDPVVVKKRVDNLSTMQDQKRELEQALSKAERANLAKTNFLSRVSHDMRTPLNGILGITALLKDRVTDEDVLQDLSQLEMSGQYLLNLVNDTLDVNKIEVGKLELHPDVYDGRAILNNVIKLIRPNMEQKKINFRIEAENLPFTVLYLDMGRLEQVVMNILSNAIKFTPKGGTITAKMTNISHDETLIRDRLVIQDTGTGMSPEFLPHLFDPFSQENPGNTGNTTGTGLGMTITKQIVELMGGTIAVESVQGKGTTFTLELPLQVATEEQIRHARERSRMNSTGFSFKNKRILVCEDHALNAEIARRLLERKEMLVDIAENGKIGLEMFAQSRTGYYDLILMDIRMPVMDGMEAAKAIRALPREDAAKIPIVAMTANAFYEDILQSQNAGMDAHLGKPIDVDKLYACIAGMLQLKYVKSKKEILIVDDQEVNRATIRAALMPEFAVYEAGNGAEALEQLRRHKSVDMVITDIQMPVMDGLELIRRIRTDRANNHIAIIANTQFGDPEQEETILGLGANDFVYKPTTHKIIELRVRNLLNRV